MIDDYIDDNDDDDDVARYAGKFSAFLYIYKNCISMWTNSIDYIFMTYLLIGTGSTVYYSTIVIVVVNKIILY